MIAVRKGAWSGRRDTIRSTSLAPGDTNRVKDVFITDLGNPFITYGYDRLDRLTSVSDPATGVGGYTYDPVGNRTSRTSDGSTYAYG